MTKLHIRETKLVKNKGSHSVNHESFYFIYLFFLFLQLFL
ncbi:hypothetical protein LDB17_09650 [Dysgonomonas sp. Shenzhen-Wh21]